MQHLEEGTIHAWLDGALTADEAAGVEAHVAACSTCAAAVAEARGLIAASSRILTALDNVPSVRGAGGAGGAKSAGRSVSTWLVRERIAAVMALVVAGGALAVVLSRPGSEAASVELVAEPVRTFEVAAADSPAPPPAVAPEARREAPRGVGTGNAAAPVSPRARDVVATTRQADGAPPAPPSLTQQATPTVANAVVGSRTDDSLRSLRVAEARREEAEDRSVEGKSVAEKVAGGLARRRAAESQAGFAEQRAVTASVGGAAGAAAPVQAPRLVQEERMLEGGREVRRRIYLVDGLLVTLDERLPSAANDMARAPVAAAPRPDSVPGMTAITWTSATGSELTLTGAGTKERLERIRKGLGY